MAIKWTQFDPEDKSTHPPMMQECLAIWLEDGHVKYSVRAVYGIQGWQIVKASRKSGGLMIATKKEFIRFDETSLGWSEISIPNWYTPAEK